MENKSKYRLIYLYQILIECSDENHPLSTMELIEILKNRHSIDVNRNTLGKDLEVMKQGGLPVEVIHSTQNKYYYDGQVFDLAELREVTAYDELELDNRTKKQRTDFTSFIANKRIQR